MARPGKNYQAFLKMDLSKAKPGEYVVVVDGKFFGKGRSLLRILKRAEKQYPGKVPMIAKMPPTRGLMAV